VWLISEYENYSNYDPSLLLHSPSDARSEDLSSIIIANINTLRVLKREQGSVTPRCSRAPEGRCGLRLRIPVALNSLSQLPQAHGCLVDDDLDQLPQLPRLESIFRDPRMQHLTHLLLSGFLLSPEQAPIMPRYMPCLQRLDCNYIPGVTSLLEVLAAAARSGSGPVGVRVCQGLRHIQLWYCNGVEYAAYSSHQATERFGFACVDEISASRDDLSAAQCSLLNGPHASCIMSRRISYY
jgi:hypothetical protein